MVAFDSTIIIREAGGYLRPTILSMSLLGGVITPDILDKDGTDFSIYPLGKGNDGCASEKYKDWVPEIRRIIGNMPLYPIQLLSNADDFAVWFINEFHIRFHRKRSTIAQIRFLEDIGEQ